MIDLRPTYPLILTGAYGSGKTEIALALAAALAADGPATLVDLDVVTPYFRAQDCREALAAQGVRVVGPEARIAQFDAPALPPEAGRALTQPDGPTVVDLGGDPVGATVIGQFTPRMVAYDLWAVVNFARPTTATPEAAAGVLAEIAATSRLRFTGLVSNTHLGPYTTAEDVTDGLARAQALGARLALPVVLACAPAGLTLPPLDLPLLPITPQLRRPWDG